MHWFEQLLGEGEVVQPFEGSRRGWNNWGGYETRGVYCVLPTAQKKAETEAERQAELARGAGSAHCDPQPSSMVVACCKTAELVLLLRFTTLSMQIGKRSVPVMWLVCCRRQISTRSLSRAGASVSFHEVTASSSLAIRRLQIWHTPPSTTPMKSARLRKARHPTK